MSAAAQQLNLPRVPARGEAARCSRPPATVLILATLKASGVPMLACEVAKAAHLPSSTVAARMGELMRTGLVLPAQYRVTSTGRFAWAFTLPEYLLADVREAAKRTVHMLVALKGRWRPGSAPAVGT